MCVHFKRGGGGPPQCSICDVTPHPGPAPAFWLTVFRRSLNWETWTPPPTSPFAHCDLTVGLIYINPSGFLTGDSNNVWLFEQAFEIRECEIRPAVRERLPPEVNRRQKIADERFPAPPLVVNAALAPPTANIFASQVACKCAQNAAENSPTGVARQRRCAKRWHLDKSSRTRPGASDKSTGRRQRDGGRLRGRL